MKDIEALTESENDIIVRHSKEYDEYLGRVDQIKEKNKVDGFSNFSHITGNLLQRMSNVTYTDNMKSPDIIRNFIEIYENTEPALGTYLRLIDSYSDFAKDEFIEREGFFPDIDSGDIDGYVAKAQSILSEQI